LEKRHRLVRERGTVSVGGQQLSRYRFDHILFQRYLYDDLSPGERRFLHRAIAQVLAKLYKAEPDEIATELAHHFLAAGDQERAVSQLVRAGDRARRLVAFDEAARFYREALEHMSASDQADRAETLRKLGESHMVTGSHDKALIAFEESHALFEALGDRQGVGTILNLLGRVKWEQARWEEAIGLCQESLAILEQLPESVELARAISGLSSMYGLNCEYEQAILWGERALELARRLGAHDVTVSALTTLGGSYASLGQFERGLSMVQDSLQRALALGLPYLATRAYVNTGFLLMSFSRHAEARAMFEALEAYGNRHHVSVGFQPILSCYLDWGTGQWASVAAYIRSFSSVLDDEEGSGRFNVYLSLLLGRMHNDLGQARIARRTIERAFPAARQAGPREHGRFSGVLARVYANLGLERETTAALEAFFTQVGRFTYADGRDTMPLLHACHWLALHPAAGRPDEAQACLRRLERADAQIGSPETTACLNEARGSVALAAGDPHEAVEHLRDATSRWEAVGRPYDHARALNHLGQAKMQTADKEGARVAFEQALAIVDHLAGQLSEEELKESFLNSALVQEIRAGLAKS
jgi:tetratricopeptide (TPR) repeat protein